MPRISRQPPFGFETEPDIALGAASAMLRHMSQLMKSRGPAREPAAPRIPQVGEPAPFFAAAMDGAPRYSLDVAAGRWIVLMFFGTLAEPASADALALALERRLLFNGVDAAFFGVSVDPADRSQRGLGNSDPGVRFFWDFEGEVSRLYGIADAQHLRPTIFLIDPMFRIVMAEPIEATETVLNRLKRAMRVAPQQETRFAPVLTLPRVFEPELCELLIERFRAGEPAASGFASNLDGRTVQRLDPRLKRRTDVLIEDHDLIATLRERIESRIFPMLMRTFGWRAQHIERYLVCRYGEEDQGFFSRHRDDATAGTAHRKFAVSLNLNADEYEGGELRFPEFGPTTYRPPTGGATIFCCSLLHEAEPVTRGERFVFVPFLYDDEGARIRRANLGQVAVGVQENRRVRRAQRRR